MKVKFTPNNTLQSLQSALVLIFSINSGTNFPCSDIKHLYLASFTLPPLRLLLRDKTRERSVAR